MTETTVSEEEIKRVDAELEAKKASEDAARKAEVEKLVDDAVAKGKEQALKEFQDAQQRKELEERAHKLESDMEKMRLDSEKKLAELSKQFEAKVQDIESQRKGISRNESPFQKGTQQPNTPQLTKEKQDEIERASMKAWYAFQGRPAPQ